MSEEDRYDLDDDALISELHSQISYDGPQRHGLTKEVSLRLKEKDQRIADLEAENASFSDVGKLRRALEEIPDEYFSQVFVETGCAEDA